MGTSRPSAIVVALLALSTLQASPAGAEPVRARVEANVARSRRARGASRFDPRLLERRRPAVARAQRPRPRSGPAAVPHNGVISGTLRQPAILFDKSDRRLKRALRRKAAKLRSSALTPWQKIERLQRIVRGLVKHAGNDISADSNPNRYTLFNRRRLAGSGLARLGEYIKLKRVVCREMAYLTQVALEDAGFVARLAVGTVRPKGTEDESGHAWNEVKLGGKWWIVDTTNPQFNRTTPHAASRTGTANGWLWRKEWDMPTVEPLGWRQRRQRR